MFTQKKFTTDGADLRLEFGFTPNRVKVENLTTGKTLEWSDQYPLSTTLLTDHATGAVTVANATVAPIAKTGIEGTSNGALGVLLPLDATDDVNNTASEDLVVSAYRDSDK